MLRSIWRVTERVFERSGPERSCLRAGRPLEGAVTLRSHGLTA
jgi:hypothetical protein